MAKKSRRNNMSRRNRKNRRNGATRRNNMRRNNMRRMMYGGYESAPGSVNGNPMAEVLKQSLAQGNQFAALHANQHGGALDAGPFPGAVTTEYMLPEALRASARMVPLDNSYTEIRGLRDQDGGRRKNRKNRKNTRKNRKNTRKNRKNTRKNRKANRKSRRNNMWSRKNRRGGSYDLANAQSVKASGMLLDSSMEAKAVSGMNAEWKLAENPMAFAPGYAKNA